MKPRFALKFILCLSFGCLARISLASEVVDTRIDAVTVYADGAKITRTGLVTLDAGIHSLLFERIPGSADASTFRVYASGTGNPLLIGIKHSFVRHEHALNARVAQFEAQIRELNEVKIPEIEDQLDVMKEAKEFLLRLARGKSDNTNRSDSVNNYQILNVTDWDTAFSFISRQLTMVTDSTRSLTQAIDEYEEKSRQLEAEKSQISSSLNRFSWSVEADIRMETSGTLQVSIEYVIPGASWSPLYIARINAESDEVEFSYYAEVRQSTGESWDDIYLTLSTSRPSALEMLRDFHPWYLEADTTVKEQYVAGRITTSTGEVIIRGGRAGDTAYMVDGRYIPDALFANSGIDFFYNTTRKTTIPTGDLVIRTAITSAHLKGSTKLICRPQNSTNIYRLMNLVNSSDATLMPGQIIVLDGSNFIGKIVLEEIIAPGQEFALPFGADNSVTLKREILVSKQSVHFNSIQIEKTFQLAFKNHSDVVKTVFLEEALPTSQDSRIKVKVDRMEPRPDGIDERGKASWSLALQPGEERLLLLSYSISYPKELTVVGL